MSKWAAKAINKETSRIEESSGGVVIFEIYFARMIGVSFISNTKMPTSSGHLNIQ